MLRILPQIALGAFGILPGNYSGITNILDSVGTPTNIYAVVDDKDKVDGFKLLTLDIDSVSGKVRNASMKEPEGMAHRRAHSKSTPLGEMEGASGEMEGASYRDCEGVAYFPLANTVFVSGEEDQKILEYSLDGNPTGRELQVPECMGRDKIKHNLGFEALTYNQKQGRFWTTTESTLLADGERSSAKNPDVENKLRFVCFDNNLKPVCSYLYKMDKAETRSKKSNCVHGIPSLIALDDGRLIVMEREGSFPKHEYGSWVQIKLYIVDPTKEEKVSLDIPMSKVDTSKFMKKTPLCSFRTHLRLGQMNLSNYEGMCLGPKLTDGRQTLILISDSQNGLGNWLYHIKDHVRLIILDDK